MYIYNYESIEKYSMLTGRTSEMDHASPEKHTGAIFALIIGINDVGHCFPAHTQILHVQ
jgi:hypothetical protein